MEHHYMLSQMLIMQLYHASQEQCWVMDRVMSMRAFDIKTQIFGVAFSSEFRL